MMNRLAAVMVVMVLGMTAWGAKAATTLTDNLQLEVTVRIPGTVDLQWATGTTGRAAGSSENGSDNRIDAVGTAGDFDLAAWTISNPDFGQTRSTDGTSSSSAALNATDGAVTLRLDNVGKRKVTVAASIAAANVDSAAAGLKWTISNAAAPSVFTLAIKAAGVATTGTAIAAADLPTTAYADLHDGTVLKNVTLCTNYGKNDQLLEVDLLYKTPTDVTSDTQLDTDHTTTITVTGTASF